MKPIHIILTLFLTSTIMANAQTETNPTVTVKGEGIVNVVPDKVTIRVRVEEQGTSAKEVKGKTDTAIDEVLKFLKEMEIKPKNMQTSYVKLDKNYDYNSKTYKYKSDQSITVTLEDLNRYERLMNGLIGSGINRIDGVQFGSSDYKVLEVEARKKAIQDAKMKAEQFAGALNQSVGKAITISETQDGNYRPKLMAMSMRAGDASEATPKETLAKGEMQITVDVNVTFELK